MAAHVCTWPSSRLFAPDPTHTFKGLDFQATLHVVVSSPPADSQESDATERFSRLLSKLPTSKRYSSTVAVMAA